MARNVVLDITSAATCGASEQVVLLDCTPIAITGQRTRARDEAGGLLQASARMMSASLNGRGSFLRQTFPFLPKSLSEHVLECTWKAQILRERNCGCFRCAPALPFNLAAILKARGVPVSVNEGFLRWICFIAGCPAPFSYDRQRCS